MADIEKSRPEFVNYFEQVINRQQLSDEFTISNRHQPSDELEMPDKFALVPWKHLPQQKLAQEVMKSPYQLGFLKLKQDHSEDDLEEALVNNITQFLLELGQGFAYVGRQMELVMPDGSTFVPDLVFYHTRLKCYIVVELKSVKFIPEYVGKLNFYVSAADELLKADDDKPTIGLLICREADKTTVEWAFRGLDRPLGVATYQIEQIVQRTILEDKLKKQKKDKEK